MPVAFEDLLAATPAVAPRWLGLSHVGVTAAGPFKGPVWLTPGQSPALAVPAETSRTALYCVSSPAFEVEVQETQPPRSAVEHAVVAPVVS